MNIESKANRVLAEARQLAEKAASWADFAGALFDYSSGLVAKVFPDEVERQTFFESKQSKEIDAILVQLMKKFGVVAGGTPLQIKGHLQANPVLPVR